MTTISDVTEAMTRLHHRDHSVLGAMMIYLHANTTTPAERAAVLNHALDAVFNLAMMVCEEQSRDAVKKDLIKRLQSLDTSAYPSREDLISVQALNGLFREGLKSIVDDEQLMNLVGALMLAKKKAGVNDIVH